MRSTRILAASLAAVAGGVGSASGQITPIGPFVGQASENFQTGTQPSGFPCMVNRPFGGTADLCTFNATTNAPVGGVLLSTSWSFSCSLPGSTGRFFGSSSGYAEYSFDAPITSFGGNFATNGNNNVTSGTTVTFYDEAGGVIGTQPVVYSACGVWEWNGWESTVPVKRIKVFGNGYTGAFAHMDEMQYSRVNVTTGACCKTDGSCIISTATSCAALSGIYRGDNTDCGSANCPQPPTGGCCFRDGTCTVLTAAQCVTQEGAYAGDGTDCVSANCAQPGACCLPDGSCVLLTQAKCTASVLGGVFQGAGTTCAANGCFTTPVLWNNAPLGTGTLSASGVTAPGGFQWSEHQAENTVYANTNLGPSCNMNSARVADDFTIVAAGGWDVERIFVYAFRSSGSSTTNEFTAATLRIWSGRPGDAGSTVIYGDTTENRLLGATFAGIYRITNTLVPATAGTSTTRPVWKLELRAQTHLDPGTYWIDWGSQVNNTTTSHQAPLSAIKGVRTSANANARQGSGTTTISWSNTVDAANPAWYPDVPMDLPFIIEGAVAGGACYPNCDGSTIVPILNVSDFICFQTKYAAGDPYANCDHSTIPPILNVSDFICFQTAYSAGCS